MCLGKSNWHSLRQNKAETSEEDNSRHRRCSQNWVMKIADKVKAMLKTKPTHQGNYDSHFDEASEANDV